MNSIQVLAEDVQGAQGRVYRIMKRPLAFQQVRKALATQRCCADVRLVHDRGRLS